MSPQNGLKDIRGLSLQHNEVQGGARKERSFAYPVRIDAKCLQTISFASRRIYNYTMG